MYLDLPSAYDAVRFSSLAGDAVFFGERLPPAAVRAGVVLRGFDPDGSFTGWPAAGAEPLFATAIAVTVLHEQPTLPVYVGTVLIVASVWAISLGQSGQTNWRLLDIFFPLGAALVSAISQSLRKQGLNILPDPFVATVTVTSVTLTLLIIFLLATRRTGQLRMGPESFRFFFIAALVAISAQISNFIALSRADVSVIIPLLNTTPFFTVLFSALFLRRMETITPRIVFGAILMVAGVVIITSR